MFKRKLIHKLWLKYKHELISSKFIRPKRVAAAQIDIYHFKLLLFHIAIDIKMKHFALKKRPFRVVYTHRIIKTKSFTIEEASQLHQKTT